VSLPCDEVFRGGHRDSEVVRFSASVRRVKHVVSIANKRDAGILNPTALLRTISGQHGFVKPEEVDAVGAYGIAEGGYALAGCIPERMICGPVKKMNKSVLSKSTAVENSRFLPIVAFDRGEKGLFATTN
jgi:hypothetical protein